MPRRENGNATWCTITRLVLAGTPGGCLLAYNHEWLNCCSLESWAGTVGLIERFQRTTHVGTLHGHKTRLVVFFSWARAETKQKQTKRRQKKRKENRVLTRWKDLTPQPCELGMKTRGIPLSTCNAPRRVTDKHTGVKIEWWESCSKRAEET